MGVLVVPGINKAAILKQKGKREKTRRGKTRIQERNEEERGKIR